MKEDAQKKNESDATVIPPRRTSIDTDEINEVRKRLYARGSDFAHSVRHSIPSREKTLQNPTVVHTEIPVPDSVTAHTVPHVIPVPHEIIREVSSETMSSKNTRKKYRKIFAIVGIIFFIISMATASFIMFWGGNTISGENISITATGALAVGGGGIYEFQVAVANKNTVPIQSATLIIEYPRGTHSASDENKEISIERQSLSTVGAGEVINVPVKARMYGEENEDKEIKVWIEYRVAGSNATFEKYAEPLKLKITTSPLVMTFQSVKKIASGQDVDLTLTVQSNSPTPLENILIKITYPEGFDFTESDLDTISGEDTWKFNELKPNEKKTIHIKGQITGHETDVRQFSAIAGISKDNVGNTLASQLATANTEISVESPFLNVQAVINGNPAETVVVNSEDSITVEITYKNTLSTTLSNGTVSVQLDGNALSDFNIQNNTGYYDSTKNIITWEGSEIDSLKEILPGETVRLSFVLKPGKNVSKTPEITMVANVTGLRISESQVSEKLEGTVSRTIKVEGVPLFTSKTNYSEGPFTNTGPVPPVAEKVTQYTYLLSVKAGTNDLTGGEVTAVLPQAVSWLDMVTPDDVVTYNATTRIMKWSIGNINAHTEATVGIQVSFLPSITQIGKIPTILETQRFKATDRFTGTTVRAEAPALTTNLSTDVNDTQNNTGRVSAQ